MARTKNRYLEQEYKVLGKIKETVMYQAGVYTRLSRERREEYRDKSNSLAIQEKIGRNYADENNIEVIKVYQDYEYSGTNFDRPGFNEMLQDIKRKVINCIIVKDLSRFGREYLEMGNYIENVFPFLGVRFIAVADNIDTINVLNSEKSIDLITKNIMNDLYSKDTSKRISIAKKIKMKMGSFIGARASYGYYVVNEKEKRVLKVDNNVKEVVKLIFSLAYEGKSDLNIARRLTEVYTTPAQYRETGEVYRKEENKKQWDAGTVNQILTNVSYIGNLIQGVSYSQNERKKKGWKKNREDWIESLHTHEAIIEKEIFDAIRRRREENKKKSKLFLGRRKAEKAPKEDRYENLLLCKSCGIPLKKVYSIRKLKDKVESGYQYFCKKGDKLYSNANHISIFEKELDKILLNIIRQILSLLQNEEELLQNIDKYYNSIAVNLKREGKDIHLDEIYFHFQTEYERYVKGEIKKEEFCKRKEIFHNEIEHCEIKRKNLKQKERKLSEKKKRAKEFLSALFHIEKSNEVKLEKNFIHTLIDHIEVSENKTITVFFKYNVDKEILSILQENNLSILRREADE